MKKSLLILLTIATLGLSACGNKPSENEEKPQEDKTFTITWKNYDETVLEIDKNVKEGTMPHYDGKDPSRKDD